MPKGVLVITGPTATGKTRLGVLLARRLNGEVVSADSMQIYKGMSIGTAAPTPEETRGVPHHLIGFADPAENYSVGRYVEDASREVDGILARGRLPILVGGTGLYIESLLAGRDFSAPDMELRERLNARYDELGGAEMLRLLGSEDPATAALLHENDKKRIVRAFEILRGSGRSKAELDAESRAVPPRYASVKVALAYAERDDLYRRIEQRVDAMLATGLADEVRALLAAGVPESSTALQAIGYKEMLGAVRGEKTLEAAAEEIKQASRRYAKRQLSWLRRDGSVNWIFWEKEPDFERAAVVSTENVVNYGIM